MNSKIEILDQNLAYFRLQIAFFQRQKRSSPSDRLGPRAPGLLRRAHKLPFPPPLTKLICSGSLAEARDRRDTEACRPPIRLGVLVKTVILESPQYVALFAAFKAPNNFAWSVDPLVFTSERSRAPHIATRPFALTTPTTSSNNSLCALLRHARCIFSPPRLEQTI
jgi:hypothetical protein